MTVRYSWSETHEENYTVGNALAAAEKRLELKGVKGVCTNAISRYYLTHPITLKRLNELSDQIVDDSIFHSGGWL